MKNILKSIKNNITLKSTKHSKKININTEESIFMKEDYLLKIKKKSLLNFIWKNNKKNN